MVPRNTVTTAVALAIPAPVDMRVFAECLVGF